MTSTTPTEPEALAAALDAVIVSAQHDMARTQTDFLGRMGQSLCEYQDIFDQNPDGDLGAEVREEADEAILSLAGLALAQLLMLRGFNHRDAAALSIPAAQMLAGEGDIAQRLKLALLDERSGDAYMRADDTTDAFLIDGTVDLDFVATQIAHPPAAEPVGLREALETIRDMKPHEAGQTANEYHMQEIARKALATPAGDAAAMREAAAKVADDELVDIFEDSPEVDTVCNAIVRHIAKAIRAIPAPEQPAWEAVPMAECWAGVPELVDKITAEEGATVTFTGPNPDFNGLPNEVAIVLRGPEWHEADYRGDTLADCLRQALQSAEGKA